MSTKPSTDRRVSQTSRETEQDDGEDVSRDELANRWDRYFLSEPGSQAARTYLDDVIRGRGK